MFYGYNDGYLGLGYYEEDLEREYIARENGFETYDDYVEYLEKETPDANKKL